jgi:UDP-glucose 4-epimerase
MDIADAHTLALQYQLDAKQADNYQVFNLGSGSGVTVLELIQAFEKVSGVKLNYTLGPRREGDVVSIFADNTKAAQQLNWHARYSLEDMMRTAWQWEQTMQEESI